MLSYTGIGSRNTPQDILDLIDLIALKLEKNGYILRSGGANGADLAFEWNVSHKEIYLPWRNFNGSSSSFTIPSIEAFNMAKPHHPNWDNLSPAVKKLMARNAHQVLGRDLNDASQFVLCWTPDGCENGETRSSRTGGTGLAIALASSLNIPVYNLANAETLDRLRDYVGV